MDPSERDLFERSVRSCLEHCDGRVPEVALGDLGWDDALRTEPRTAIAVLFGLQGYLHAISPLDVVLAPLLSPGHPERAVVLPAIGSGRAPGEVQHGRILVHGTGTCRLAGAELATLAVRRGLGKGARILTVPVKRLALRPVVGLDPDLGLVAVNGTVDDPADPPPAGSSRADAEDRSSTATDAWDRAVARARLALAHELAGAARRMLELARDHATERVQFGRAIASFQAVRHRLADGLVAVDAAEASVEAAWEEGSTFGAAVAKAVAGRNAQLVARQAQQVLAGMGFTAEHPLHRFVKRTVALDHLFGSAASLSRQIGADLIAARSSPPALPL